MKTPLLAWTVLLLWGVDSVLGQARNNDPPAGAPSAEIERILDQEQDMLFNDATLEDLAGFLTARGIPTYIDRALDDVGLGTDTPITFRQPAIRLRDGLQLILRSLDLSWTFQRRRLVITTPEEEEGELITQVYDVRNLVELVSDPYWGSGFGLSQSTMVYCYDFDSLIRTITSTIDPDTWDEVGGPGNIEPYYTRRMRVIVVSQTYETHRKLQALLRELAEHGGSTPLHGVQASSIPNSQPTPQFRAPSSQPFGPRAGIRASQLRTTAFE